MSNYSQRIDRPDRACKALPQPWERLAGAISPRFQDSSATRQRQKNAVREARFIVTHVVGRALRAGVAIEIHAQEGSGHGTL
jgi:hypothetical protein